MKRIFGFLLMAALVLSVVPTAQAAQGRNSETRPACTFEDADKDGLCDNRLEECGKTFVDEDGDGLCDNRLEECGKAFVDEDGDGLCDNRREGCGKAFADEGGDGICDNRSRNTCPQEPRQGRCYGQRNGCRGR